MEGMLSASEKQSLVSSFLEIAVGQTAETALQFYKKQATSWKLDEAIQLFDVGNEGGVVATALESPAVENVDPWVNQNSGELKEPGNNNVGPICGDEVRPPLPVVRKTLYDDAMLYGASRLGYPPQQSSSSSLIAFNETNEDEEMLRAVAASIKNVKDPIKTTSDNKVLSTTDKEEPCLTKKPTYPPLPQEPKGDRNLLCRVGVRLSDGRRVQRNFLRTDPIQLLWSFCYSQLGGASKSLDYDNKLTFVESGFANSMISVAWK